MSGFPMFFRTHIHTGIFQSPQALAWDFSSNTQAQFLEPAGSRLAFLPPMCHTQG